jgi:hypothetical protein
MKQDNRIQQLIQEIGPELLKQAVETERAEERLRTYILPAKWFRILERLDKTMDPAVLLPLLNVPPKVLPHFEEALAKRLKLCRRTEGHPPVPSYLPVAQKEAEAWQAGNLVQHLVSQGAPQDKAVELMALMCNIPRTKLEAVLAGKASGLRNLRARRAAR